MLERILDALGPVSLDMIGIIRPRKRPISLVITKDTGRKAPFILCDKRKIWPPLGGLTFSNNKGYRGRLCALYPLDNTKDMKAQRAFYSLCINRE